MIDQETVDDLSLQFKLIFGHLVSSGRKSADLCKRAKDFLEQDPNNKQLQELVTNLSILDKLHDLCFTLEGITEET